MKVSDLIEKLQQLNQDSHVNCYGGYCPEYGKLYNDLSDVEEESIGWDEVNDCALFEVYLK